MPSFGRMMVFVDGENIVFRYQSMIKKGFKPKNSVKHVPDVYVWCPNTVEPGLNEIIRTTYYTYVVGDDKRFLDMQTDLKSLTFNSHSDSRMPNNLYPCIFKKSKRSAKSKGVDIQMTVDILSNVYKNNIDTVYLVSGDGDYKPVIDEVIRNGKHIYLAAFSDGLNPNLRHSVDKFIDLDKIYF